MSLANNINDLSPTLCPFSLQLHSGALGYVYFCNAPPPCPTPDGEKSRILEKLLYFSRGNRTEAFRYLEHVKKLVDSDAPQIGFQCPKETITCNAVEFDNIKVFYHLTSRDLPGAWNFYIARPGAYASQCIDWAAEGIKIDACSPTGEWGKCMMLMVTSGARVRITYPCEYGQRTHEIVFPSSNDPSVPTTYLENMSH